MEIIKNKIYETCYDFHKGYESDYVFIFVHGALSTNQFWDLLYKKFLNYGDVILLNLIGHAPSKASWTDLKDVKGILNAQNNSINKIIKKHYKNINKKIVLIGHSTGGTLALVSDIFFSKKYHATIALTPIIKLNVGAFSPLNIPLNVLSKTSDENLWKYNFDILQHIVKNHNDIFSFFILIFGSHKRNLEETEKIYMEKFSDKILEQNHMALKYYSIFFNDLHNNSKNSLYNKYKDFLKGKITTKNPSLILGGKDDLMVDVQQQREAAAVFKAKYVELENCGHFCTLDSLDRIFEEIKIFLNLN